MSWFSLPMFGQSSTPLTTTDHFTIEPVTVQPGGETVGFVVGVEGSRLYTAYNMEIELPEGVTLSKDEYGNQAVMSLDEGSINPVQQSAYGPMPMHLFSYLEQSTGNLRVACFSSTNADFTAESGNLFTVYVKASPYACPGEKTRVQFVRIPFLEKYLMALMPSAMQGTFTTMFGCKAANSSPSLIIPS